MTIRRAFNFPSPTTDPDSTGPFHDATDLPSVANVWYRLLIRARTLVMTVQEVREIIIEDCNQALHHARGPLDWKLKAIIIAQRELFSTDNKALRKLYDRLPASMRS